MSSQASTESVWKTVADLQKMTLEQLQAEYIRYFGKKTKSRSRKKLYTAIAQKAQEGGSPEGSKSSPLTAKLTPKRKRPAKRQSKPKAGSTRPRKARTRPLGVSDPRLPQVGSIITKTYKGNKLRVKVTDSGFEYGGKSYRSLSAVAREVTGAIWNGFLFFGLTERPKQKD